MRKDREIKDKIVWSNNRSFKFNLCRRKILMNLPLNFRRIAHFKRQFSAVHNLGMRDVMAFDFLSVQ